MSVKVHVAAFRPSPDDGGIGGFNWFLDRHEAAVRFSENVTDFPEDEHALWTHTTDFDTLTQREQISDEIDALEWGWFPEEAKHTATVWTP